MFWIISAILVLIALAFILPGLLRKEYEQDATREQNIAIAREQLADLELRQKQNDITEENYQLIKEELERALFDDLKQSDAELVDVKKQSSNSIGSWLILLLIPVITIPIYLDQGNLDYAKQLDPKKANIEKAQSTMPLKADGTPDIEQVAQNLKKEMENNPTDPKGWYMLGRAYMMIQRFPEAAESFDKSLALRPNLPETMLSLADALSMNNEGKLIGRPRELVNKALETEPNNLTALWLSGMAASQEAEYVEAIRQWEKVLPLLDDKHDEKVAITGLIAEAKTRLTPDMVKQLANGATQEKGKLVEPDQKNKSIKVRVSLSDTLKDKVSPDDSVFVYATAMSGPPMPLAAVRKQVKDFPFELVLDDKQAMMPNLKISSFKSVTVGARISKAGQAIAQDGDFFDEKIDIKLGEDVSLEINKTYKK